MNLAANTHGLITGRVIRVRGIVQGVGFRPAVWRLACRHSLSGQVANDTEGVIIHVWGDAVAIESFIHELSETPPPLAHIDRVETAPIHGPPGSVDFRIISSHDGTMRTQVPPDTTTCPECLDEILDPTDRRHGYPFTNCTHCGPRLTLIEAMPYDRPNTSMARFPMCPACRAEYGNPADRRFHAQPNACPRCGPRVWLADAGGHRIDCTDPLTTAADLIKRGKILAVRGIGGFHLVVDATDAEAVRRLRERKRRPCKPLALMARDIETIRRYRNLNDIEIASLTSPAAPIVLLERPGADSLPDAIAPRIQTLGFMLPMSPMHHLLLARCGTPLVFTSGNRTGQPQCTANQEALTCLRDIADAFLLHDREIVNRVDDSVLRLIGGHAVPLRRSRGYAPAPVSLPAGFEDCPSLLALGGETKNTFCLLRDGQAILSHHIGDLGQPDTWRDWLEALTRYRQLYDHIPGALAIDLHPAYRTSDHGRRMGEVQNLPVIEVAHHHAHHAACLADNGVPLEHPPVLGIVLDGIGYGPDGTGWGGELLLAGYRDCQRLAWLQPAPLPGGETAMREPWRNLAARLFADPELDQCVTPEASVAALRRLATRPLPTLRQMIYRGINSPPASSTGRLFDAVAELLDIAPPRLDFEGQAAIWLEQQAWSAKTPHPLRFVWCEKETGWQMETRSLWQGLLDGLQRGASVPALALGFHQALAEAWAAMTLQLADRHRIRQVTLSGGVMQNRLLHELLAERLTAGGLQVLSHCQVPANDGGLALGQACIAAARLISSSGSTPVNPSFHPNAH